MTTRVHCVFVTPHGLPVVNSPVEFQPVKAGFAEELEGIVMPRPADAVTDANGECTVDLWPSLVPYYVRCSDAQSEAEVTYKILVPVVNPGVVLRLQDLVIEDTAQLSLTGVIKFQVLSNTQVKISLVGSDGISRYKILDMG